MSPNDPGNLQELKKVEQKIFYVFELMYIKNNTKNNSYTYHDKELTEHDFRFLIGKESN